MGYRIKSKKEGHLLGTEHKELAFQCKQEAEKFTSLVNLLYGGGYEVHTKNKDENKQTKEK